VDDGCLANDAIQGCVDLSSERPPVTPRLKRGGVHDHSRRATGARR
jgi:hypothetical protein